MFTNTNFVPPILRFNVYYLNGQTRGRLVGCWIHQYLKAESLVFNLTVTPNISMRTRVVKTWI